MKQEMAESESVERNLEGPVASAMNALEARDGSE